MKKLLIILTSVFLIGCNEKKPEQKAPEVNFPEAEVEVKFHHPNSKDFMKMTYEVGGNHTEISGEPESRKYNKSVEVKNIKVKYEVISSQLISSDTTNMVKDSKYIELMPADVYLFQAKRPSQDWEAKAIVYTGEQVKVYEYENLKVTIK